MNSEESSIIEPIHDESIRDIPIKVDVSAINEITTRMDPPFEVLDWDNDRSGCLVGKVQYCLDPTPKNREDERSSNGFFILREESLNEKAPHKIAESFADVFQHYYPEIEINDMKFKPTGLRHAYGGTIADEPFLFVMGERV